MQELLCRKVGAAESTRLGVESGLVRNESQRNICHRPTRDRDRMHP